MRYTETGCAVRRICAAGLIYRSGGLAGDRMATCNVSEIQRLDERCIRCNVRKGE